MTATIAAFLLLAANSSVPVLPQVTVAATPVVQEERVAKDGSDRTTVARDQLSALNAQDLQTALRQIPGITISRYAPIGSYGGAQGGSVYVRGMGTARPGGEVRTYTDGAPRGSGMWSHPLMDSMPVDFAESVSVQKSPHPARYADAFGSVDVETRRRREPGHEGELAQGCGRYGTLLSALSAGFKEGPADAYAGVAGKYSDGVRDHNRSRLHSAYARLGCDFSATEHLGFVYQRTGSRVEDPGEQTSLSPRTDRFDLDTDLWTMRLDSVRDSLTGYSLVYCERGAIDWWQDNLCRTPLGPMDGVARTEWINFGMRSFFDWSPTDALWLSFGLDVAAEDGETMTVNRRTGAVPFRADGLLGYVSPYLGLRRDFEVADGWTLTPYAGARHYFHRRYDDEWSPAASLTLDRDGSLQLFVNGSRGVHYPGVYTRAVSADYARDTLSAETMHYVSAGVAANLGDDANVILTVFRTEAQNRIDKTNRGYVNAGGMRATGAEASGRWRPSDELAFFAGLAFANPETSPVSRLPRWSASAGAVWKICEHLQWSIDGQHLGAMNAYSVRASAEAADLRELDPGLLLNTRFAVPLESFSPLSGEISAAVENLTNINYEYYPGYPIGGIMFYLGVKLRF